MEWVYKFIFFVLYYVLSIGVFVHQLWKQTLKEIKLRLFTCKLWFWNQRGGLDRNLFTRFQITVYSLKKVPTHLGIILNEEDISLSWIARFTVWCLSVGISHLSILDNEGTLKSNEVSLLELLIQEKEKYFDEKAEKFKINIINRRHRDGFTNGMSYDRELNLTLLCREDGRRNIAKAAKNFCKEIQRQELKPNDLTKESFGSYISALAHSTPDPELLIIFGSGYSLVGYLPWHIHLSEIFFKSNHRNFDITNLEDVLLNYSSSQQRYGR